MPTTPIKATVKATFEVEFEVDVQLDMDRPVGVMVDTLAQAAQEKLVSRVDGLKKSSATITEVLIAVVPPASQRAEASEAAIEK